MPHASNALASSRPRRELIRSVGRSPEIVAFEQAILGFFIETAELLSIPKSVAAIYGLCFASPEPLGFSEIQDRLDISAGSISQGLRVLRDVGALKCADNSSDRRDRFEPDLELRKLISHYMDQRLQKQLNSGRDRLRAIVKALPGGKDGSAKVLRNRLETLQNWHEKTRGLLPIVKIFLKVS